MLTSRDDTGQRRIGLDDLIHIDVPPAASGRIHDLKLRRLIGKTTDIPLQPVQMLAISHADRRTHHLSVHQQIQARLPTPIATTDEEADILALDRERW